MKTVMVLMATASFLALAEGFGYPAAALAGLKQGAFDKRRFTPFNQMRPDEVVEKRVSEDASTYELIRAIEEAIAMELVRQREQAEFADEGDHFELAKRAGGESRYQMMKALTRGGK